MQITFYFDVGCPHSYLASLRVNSVSQRASVAVDWVPVLSGDVTQPAVEDTPGKKAYTALDLQRQAEFYGVTMRSTAAVDAHVAMRLLLTVSGEQRIALAEALFAALFAHGRDITDRDTLAAVCHEQALDPSLAKRSVDRDELKQLLTANAKAATDDGVFALPSVIVAQGKERTLFYGVDRLRIVARLLNLRDDTVVRSRFEAKQGPEVAQFYYDFISPYSYVAATQIEHITARHGAKVEWKPMFLGGLFRNLNVAPPLQAASPQRAKYLYRDMGDWADYYGVQWRWPENFPISTVTALRLALLVDTAHVAPLSLALFRAYWRQGRDISDPQVIRDVAHGAGFAPEVIERACSKDPSVKQLLIDATDAAQKAGVFGAPTYFVRNHMFWGQDRLPMVERVLAGWQPRAG